MSVEGAFRVTPFNIYEHLPQLDFVQNRIGPEKFVCDDLFPSLFKGKYDPSEVPTISQLIVISDEGLWNLVQPEFIRKSRGIPTNRELSKTTGQFRFRIDLPLCTCII